jgi:hypothetical protein
MKSPRKLNYPMPLEDAKELAAELSEFGFRETDDPDEADRRRYYKVERWDSAESQVLQLLHASNDLGRARAVFASETKRRPRGRLYAAPGHPGAEALASRLGPQDRCEKLG